MTPLSFPLSFETLQGSRAFAVEHPRSILIVPKEQRSSLLADVVGDLELRRNLLLCYHKQRRFFPWSVYPTGKTHDDKADFINRYMVVGPRAPLRMAYDRLADYLYLLDDMDLVVADDGDHLKRNSGHRKPLFKTQGRRRIMFTENPLRNPRVLHYHLKWCEPGLFGSHKRLCNEHLIRIPSESGYNGLSKYGVGYRNVDQMIEKLNTVLYPPATRARMWEWIQEWIGRRGRKIFSDVPDEEFARAKIPQMET